MIATAREAARIAYALALGWLARLSATRSGLVLVYHRVGGDTAGDPGLEILPAVTRGDFAGHLRHLRRRYRVVAASEILDAARSRRRGQRFPVSITFDDDLESHLQAAAPALQQEGLHGTFFLSGSSLREPHSFWWEDLQRAIDGKLVRPDGVPHVPEADVRAALERSPKAIFRVAGAVEQLESGQRTEVAIALREAAGPPAADSGLRSHDVRGLATAGCGVGFHTLRHDLLPALSDAALDQAMHDGREALGAAVGHRLELISYPHGKADRRVAEAARAAGFTLGFTTERRLVTPDSDPLLIPRLGPPMTTGKLALRLARAFAKA